jgi:hypothetical protein
MAKLGLIVAVFPNADDLRLSPSNSVIVYPGIVGVPPPKAKFGATSQRGCATLFATIAAMAPAAAAFETFTLTLQVPRSMSRICPE